MKRFYQGAFAVLAIVGAAITPACFFGSHDHDFCQCVDDNHACTVEECDGDECVHTKQEGEIESNDKCLSLTCEGGLDPKKRSIPNANPDDGTVCTIDSCGPDGEIHDPVPDGTFCEDGGICKSGFCMPCDDFNECTTEECTTGELVVTSTLPPGSECGTGRFCDTMGLCKTCDDNDPCTDDECSTGVAIHNPRPELSACSTGSQEGVCEKGTCVTWCVPLPDPATCPDNGVYESGGGGDDTSSGGPNFDDDDGAPRPICGVLKGSDADWVSYFAEDEPLETDINDFHIWSFGKSIRFCAFETCSKGTTHASCSSGGVLTTFSSMPGCCWTGVFESMTYLHMDLTCDNPENDDSGWVHMRFDDPSTGGCVPYGLLDYGY